MRRARLEINGVAAPEGPRWCPPPPEPRQRIFDHFTGGEPEDKRFSAVAHAMRMPKWWTCAPPSPAWVDPPDASGECDGTLSKLCRFKARLDAMTPRQLDEAIDVLADALDRKRGVIT